MRLPERPLQYPLEKFRVAIYAARGLRSGTAEITSVVFTPAVAGNFLKNEMRKLDIFQVASNVSLVAEAGCGRRA